MKKLTYLILLSLLLLTAPFTNLHAQTGIRVTFILTSPDLPDDTSVYITGSVEPLGMWNPGKVKMEPKGSHKRTKKIQISRPLSIEYKYTLGSWEREGADANGSPLSNFAVTHRKTKPFATLCSSGPKAHAGESTTVRSRARYAITAV